MFLSALCSGGNMPTTNFSLHPISVLVDDGPNCTAHTTYKFPNIHTLFGNKATSGMWNLICRDYSLNNEYTINLFCAEILFLERLNCKNNFIPKLLPQIHMDTSSKA